MRRVVGAQVNEALLNFCHPGVQVHDPLLCRGRTIVCHVIT
jgi:hypothetical protein